MSKKILVTGGSGYIGTHTCVELLEAGHQVVVVDNLSNSKQSALEKVQDITGSILDFYRVDIRDRDGVGSIFEQHNIDVVIHFAGLKSIGESLNEPLRYYDNNVTGTITLLDVMAKKNVRNLVFSSTAAVYGNPQSVPVKEDFPVGGTTNPYATSKLMIEEVLRDLVQSNSEWHIANLRYFNPVGAHSSGLIGEDPVGVPNNLMPLIAQVASGERDYIHIFGDDYSTQDGTCIRDYIHVVDLAKGHLSALDYLLSNPGLLSVNLGTGMGCSVLEMIRAFEQASGQEVPYKIDKRRPGDVASCYADVKLAEMKLNWRAKLGLKEMCADTWRWKDGVL